MSFHFNVPERTDYVCRLVRKATRAGASLVLTGPAAALAHFDRVLWTFDPLEFLPHVLVQPGRAVPDRLRGSPVWLAEDPLQAEHHDVLINLGVDAPAGFESFARVIELVSTDETDKIAGRLRWKHYATRGYAIDKREVGA